jgi:predicted AAA+ superfamily ATPase
MDKAFWATIIKDFHEKELPATIERDYRIPTENPINRSTTLVGGRRSGKTYELYNIIKKIVKENKKTQVVYINFEKTELETAKAEDLLKIKEAYAELYPENKKKWFILDEIQKIPGWETFARQCLDEGIIVFLSGSSSKLLSKEIATSMRGRNLTYTIMPFSFKEILFARGINQNKYYSTTEKALIQKTLEEYMTFGGYPETVLYPQEREKILGEIMQTTIYKDVQEREKIRNIKALKLLLKALINAKEFSTNKFYNYLKTQGIKISKNTIYNYIEYFKDAYILFTLNKHAYSYKKEEQTLPKIYFIDNGLLQINGITDKGRLFENMIFLELVRREKQTAYFKTPSGEEVDFVIKNAKKTIQLIQASISLENPETKEREIKNLIKASKELKCNNLLIITLEEEQTIKHKGKTIKITPAWKWMLNTE